MTTYLSHAGRSRGAAMTRAPTAEEFARLLQEIGAAEDQGDAVNGMRHFLTTRELSLSEEDAELITDLIHGLPDPQT